MSSNSPLKPSSGTEGFFQEPPELYNQFEEDTTLRRLFDLYIPPPHHGPLSATLHAFASEVLTPEIFAHVADAEAHPPTLSTHTTFGAPRSELRTSAGWRALGKLAVERALVRGPHEAAAAAAQEPGAHAARPAAAFMWHVWTASCATASCPVAMADGAATLLAAHVRGPCHGGGEAETRRRVFGAALARLTSPDPARAWTSGQWMTERAGGSDVRLGTETVATRVGMHEGGGLDEDGLPLGPWRVDGFKWFSSATDAQMTVLLARTAKGGISAFYAPLRRRASPSSAGATNPPATESNGVTIQRLKPKLGTRALPTAELELRGLRAWMIGTEGQGTREIAAVLNVTRVHTAIGALGYWGRGLAISRAYARVRRVGGGGAGGAGETRLLVDVPAHARSVADNTTAYAAMMHLGFLVAALMGISERPASLSRAPPSQLRCAPVVDTAAEASALFRLLTPVAKAACAKRAVAGLQECMESLGGVGYIEDEQRFNVARLFRDANVLSIWEGTTDVLAADVVRVLTGRQGAEVRRTLDAWVSRRVDGWPDAEWGVEREVVRTENWRLEEMFAAKSVEELTYMGREILESLAWLASSVMMVEDATRDSNAVAAELARRWVSQRAEVVSIQGKPWQRRAMMDRQIAFPETSNANNAAKL